MPLVIGRIGGGGGSGGGRTVGALLRQGNDAAVGLFIGYRGATEAWHLRGVERQDAEASVAASAQYDAGSGNSLALTFADDPASQEKQFTKATGAEPEDPEQVNLYNFVHREYPNPQSLATARADYGDLRITSAVSGAAGNSDRYRVTAGTPASPGDPAYADVLGENSNFLRVYTTLRGTVGNTGEVRVVTGGARTENIRPSRTLNVAGTGDTAANITLERTNSFVDGVPYGLTTVQYRGANSDNTVQTFWSGTSMQIAIRGTVTLNDIIAAINGNSSAARVVQASLPSSVQGTTQVTWDSTDTARNSQNLRYSGGSVEANPLAAVWDDTNKRLTITAIATDTLREVRTVVAALSEFQEGSSGISPGDLDFGVGGGSGADSVITVDATVGNHIDYAFGRGANTSPRTPLVVRSITDTDGGGHQLQITGVIHTDTTQDVIDEYSGGDFVLSSAGGDASATLSGNTVALTSLAGGRDQVLRELPDVEFNGNRTYTIFYHGPSTSAGQRTTLAEMRTAWQSITNGLSPSIALTGAAGSRITAVPTAPTGGSDFEDADSITAIIRPNDEVNGSNVEIRYHAVNDTLEEIADALALEGRVTVVAVYGTDLDAAPENPPFTRSMFAGGGEGVSGITGITIQDEAVVLATSADTLIFEGAGVTASGTGKTKRINIPGGGGDGGAGQRPFFQYANGGDLTAWSDTWSAGEGYLRIAVGATKPADDSSDWSDPIRFEGDSGPPGPGGARLWIQYSDDNSSWHDTLVPATDIYIRFALGAAKPADNDSAWSDGVRFKGEQGPGGGTDSVSGGGKAVLGIDSGAVRHQSGTQTFPGTPADISLDADNAGNDITPDYISNINETDDTVDLTQGEYIVTMNFDLYNASSGTTAYTLNQRFNIQFQALSGTDVISELLTNPYVRPITAQYGHESRSIIFRLDADGPVKFQSLIVGSQTGAYLLPSSLTFHRITGVRGIPGTGGGGDGASLSDATPQAPGTADAGTSDEASRADHVHPTPLTDDAVTPAMLDADTAAKKNAFRARLGAGTSDLTQNQVDARVQALVDALALAGDTDRWPKDRLPTDIIYQAAFTRVIQSADADSIPNWGSGNTYGILHMVKHNGATYISIAATGNTNKEPGVASDWKDFWLRIGYEDGAPDSLDGASISGSTLTLDRRNGTTQQLTLPSGGTTVAANPAGTDGDDLERLTIGSTNYNIPKTGYAFYARPSFTFTDRAAVVDMTTGPWTTTLLDAVSIPGRIYSEWDFVSEWFGVLEFDVGQNGEVAFTLKTTHVFNSKTVVVNRTIHLAVNRSGVNSLPLGTFNSVSRIAPGSFTDDDGNTVTITEADLAGPVTMTFELSAVYDDNRGQGSRSFSNVEWVGANGRFYQLAHGSGAVTPPPIHQPHISNYQLTSGDIAPVAGSIAGDTYGVSWAIAQSEAVGAARIIGFKGAFDASNVAVLATINSADYAHGSASLAVPAGITLAADEVYHLRLQVFGEGTTAPGPGTQPVSYQDINVTAHAPATANYHWGRLPRIANKTAAQYAADVVFGTTGSGTDLVTDAEMNVEDGYDATPGASGGWVFYYAAKADEPQPSGWTTNGQPASVVFQAAVDQAYSSVAYKVYVMLDLYYRTIDDGSENYKPVS